MPPSRDASYARAVTTPTRAGRARRAAVPDDTPDTHDPNESAAGAGAEKARVPNADSRPANDPDGGAGDLHELLVAGVDGATRLLQSGGAIGSLVDPATGQRP